MDIQMMGIIYRPHLYIEVYSRIIETYISRNEKTHVNENNNKTHKTKAFVDEAMNKLFIFIVNIRRWCMRETSQLWYC